MSMHLKPMTQEEESGLRAHGLPVGTPSQLADAFRLGMAWADKARAEAALAEPQPDADGWIPWAATATSQCPVGQDTWVAVRLANGQESKEGKPHQAGQFSGAFFPQVPSSPIEW